MNNHEKCLVHWFDFSMPALCNAEQITLTNSLANLLPLQPIDQKLPMHKIYQSNALVFIVSQTLPLLSLKHGFFLVLYALID